MVDGDPSQIVAADLPPVDGIALCAAHEGRSHLLLRWIDPSVVDEHDALSVDPALDIYERANWTPDAASAPRFSVRLPAILHGRATRTIAIGWRGRQPIASPSARDAVALLDEAFIVHRTHADPCCLDLSLDANDRALGKVWATWGKVPSIRRRQRDGPGHLADRVPLAVVVALARRRPENLARTSVPALLLTYSADQSTFPSTRRLARGRCESHW